MEQVGVPTKQMGVRGGHQSGASTRDVVELKRDTVILKRRPEANGSRRGRQKMLDM